VSFFEAKIMESHTKGPSDIKNFTMKTTPLTSSSKFGCVALAIPNFQNVV